MLVSWCLKTLVLFAEMTDDFYVASFHCVNTWKHSESNLKS